MSSSAHQSIRSDDVPNDSERAIRTFSLSATKVIIGELAQLRIMVNQKWAIMDINNATYSQKENALKEIVVQHFGRDPMQRLGLTKKITLNIADSINDLPNSKTVFRFDNDELVPHKLLRKFHEPAVKEAHPKFVQDFTTRLNTDVGVVTAHQGQAVEHIFERQWAFHQEKAGRDQDEECCVFRLLETEYHTPYFINDVNHKVVEFEFECPTCQGRHSVRVYR